MLSSQLSQCVVRYPIIPRIIPYSCHNPLYEATNRNPDPNHNLALQVKVSQMNQPLMWCLSILCDEYDAKTPTIIFIIIIIIINISIICC